MTNSVEQEPISAPLQQPMTPERLNKILLKFQLREITRNLGALLRWRSKNVK